MAELEFEFSSSRLPIAPTPTPFSAQLPRACEFLSFFIPESLLLS